MQVIESADCAGTVDDAVIVDSSPARTLVASWLVAADGCRPADPTTAAEVLDDDAATFVLWDEDSRRGGRDHADVCH